MKQQPFHTKQIPKPDQTIQNWYRRNIIMDHPHRIIYVQVMWDSLGELSLSEYNYIKAGSYWQFIPLELVDHIREGIASGYTVKPMVLAGSPVGEMHTVLQILDMVDTHHVVNDSRILKPVLND